MAVQHLRAAAWLARSITDQTCTVTCMQRQAMQGSLACARAAMLPHNSWSPPSIPVSSRAAGNREYTLHAAAFTLLRWRAVTQGKQRSLDPPRAQRAPQQVYHCLLDMSSRVSRYPAGTELMPFPVIQGKQRSLEPHEQRTDAPAVFAVVMGASGPPAALGLALDWARTLLTHLHSAPWHSGESASM